MARKKNETPGRPMNSRAERKADQHQKGHGNSPPGSANGCFDGAMASGSGGDLRVGGRRLGGRRQNRNSDSYLQPGDDHFINFQNQLNSLGLAFRDIPGDGNCLFRALGDQLEGHGRNHFQHRMDTVRFMIQNRKDFEPFVSDEMPYERYIDLLARPGTYAGQDALVAFARLHKLNIVIHQLHLPLWQIEGGNPGCRQLHLSYHNGEHYSSVRHTHDNSEAPANIRLSSAQEALVNGTKASKSGPGQSMMGNNNSVPSLDATLQKNNKLKHLSPAAAFLDSATEDDFDSGAEFTSARTAAGEETGCLGTGGLLETLEDTNDPVQYIIDSTGCEDVMLIEEVLSANQCNVESAVDYLLGLMCGGSVSNLDDGSSAPSEQNQNQISQEKEVKEEEADKKSENIQGKGGAKPKVQQKKLTNRERKALNQRQKMEKKEEKRQRQKELDEAARREEGDSDTTTFLSQGFSLLSL